MSDKEELTNLTDSIRGAWAWTNATSAEEEDANAEEFDDWLRRVRAEAAAEQRSHFREALANAWDEGYEFVGPRPAVNPYRGFTPMEGTKQ